MPSVRSVRAVRDTTAAARAEGAVRAAAFWSAVVLPFSALAVLAVGGDLTLVGALLAVNAAALFVGHGYHAHATVES
jgi:hypothetical protein